MGRPRQGVPDLGRLLLGPSTLTKGMESVTVVTPPATTSVTVEELSLHLRLNDDSEDTLLSDWLLAADDLFTRMSGYVLVPQTLRLNLDGWVNPVLYVPRHPVTAVTAVEYLDQAGDWQTVDAENYAVDLSSVPARVSFSSTWHYPQLHLTQRPAVRVTFTAGSTAPPLAKVAVRLLAAHWYAQREAYGTANLTEVPAGWGAVLDQFRTGVTGNWNEEVGRGCR